MTSSGVIRRTVIAANTIPSVRRIQIRFYSGALNYAVREFSSLPQIEAVLLREGKKGPSWNPGLSDLDLTVILKPVSLEQRYDTLNLFWRKYRSVKRFIPILGEVDVFWLEEFKDYVEYGPGPTAMTKKHRVRKTKSQVVNRRLQAILKKELQRATREDLFREILCRYVNVVIPRALAYETNPRFLEKKLFEHATLSVARHLEDFTGKALSLFDDPMEMMANITKSIETIVSPMNEYSEPLQRDTFSQSLASRNEMQRHLSLLKTTDGIPQSIVRCLPYFFPFEMRDPFDQKSCRSIRLGWIEYVRLRSLLHNWRIFSAEPAPVLFTSIEVRLQRCQILMGEKAPAPQSHETDPRGTFKKGVLALDAFRNYLLKVPAESRLGMLNS